MSADPRVSLVRPLAERVARGAGLDVFDVHLRREAIGWVLRVVLDRPLRRDATGAIVVEGVDEGIGVDECQAVSQDLSALLDVEEVVDVPYTLEVSSPGLDRALRGEDDYRRFVGRVAKIVVKAPIDGQSHFEGRLSGVTDGEVIMQVGRAKVARIPLASISRAKLAVEF